MAGDPNNWAWATDSGLADYQPTGMLGAPSLPQTTPANFRAPWDPDPVGLPDQGGEAPQEAASDVSAPSPVPEAALSSSAPTGQPAAPEVAPLPTPAPIKTDKYGVPIAPSVADQTAGMNDAYQQHAAAANQLTDAQLAQQDEKSRFADEQQRMYLDQAAHQHAMAKERETALAEADQRVAEAEKQIHEVDPNHWMHTASATQQLGAGISAILGGFMAPYNGGRNTGIEQINHVIAQDIDAQKENNALAQYKVGQAEKARAGVEAKHSRLLDDDNLQFAARLKSAIAMNDANMAQTENPIILAKGAELKAGLMDAYQQRIAAAAQTARDNAMKQVELTQQIRAQRAQAAAQARAAKLAERNQARDEYLSDVKYDPATGTFGPLGRPMTLKEQQAALAQQASNRKAEADAIKAEHDAVLASKGITPEETQNRKDLAGRSVNGFDGKPLLRTVVGPDGKPQQVPVYAKTPEARTEIGKAGASLDKVQRAVDLLKQNMRENGGHIKWLGSKQAQQAQAALASIDIANKDAAGLGALSGSDFELLHALRGGVDPSSFIKDGSSGLDAMVDRAAEGYNAKLRQDTDYADSVGSAPPIRPPRTSEAQAAELRPEQKVQVVTVGDPSVVGDKQAEAKDREFRLASLADLIKHDKPSAPALERMQALIGVDKAMPDATKRDLMEAIDKQLVQSRKEQPLRDLNEQILGAFGQTQAIPENMRLGLPK